MAFSRVKLALNSLGLENQYLQNFISNEIDDETIEDCMKDTDASTFVSNLSSVMPAAGHRMKFLKVFKSVLVLSSIPTENASTAGDVIQDHKQNNGEIVEDGIAEEMIKLELDAKVKDSWEQRETELKKQNADTQAKLFLFEAKDHYVNKMRNAVEQYEEENELQKAQSIIRHETIAVLKTKLKDLDLSPSLLNQGLEELNSYVDREFEGTTAVFRMKKEEDEFTVKTALLGARTYYSAEMEKHFQAKDWLRKDELESLHKEIGDAAIEKSKVELELTPRQEKRLRDALHLLFETFEEKNLISMPRDAYPIGIDLGTTYSCAAVCIKGKIHVIPCDEKATVPSYVAFYEDHAVSVGEAAKDQSFRRPESTIFDVKRLIGRKFNDPVVQDDMKLWPFQVVSEKGQPMIKIPQRPKAYRPEEISARVLSQLKKLAEEYLNKKVTYAVVTVPAYFNDSQRQATKDAAEIVGLNAKIINEPTSAAIAYYYESQQSKDLKRNVLIFDLGGGTFDVAVLEMEAGKIETKAIGGDTHLGGEDFDNEMVKHIIKKVKQNSGIDLGRDMNKPEGKRKASERLRRIRSVCEKQKRILSFSSSTTIAIDRIDGNYDLYEPFTRKEFEDINLSKFEKCIAIMDQVISEARMKKSDIDDIVLIGGSTRIPKVRELLSQYFDGKTLNSQIKADEAVAFGAAIQAALDYGKDHEVPKKVSVSDVTPFSIGIEADEDFKTGVMAVIIKKNTPVPCCRSKEFSTSRDGQIKVLFSAFEGEKAIAEENHKLGEFILNNVPSAPKGKEKLDVSMNINSEGILHVKAVCRSTGGSKGVQIETYKGRMSRTEIELAKSGIASFRW